jgi:hypothetical protein
MPTLGNSKQAGVRYVPPPIEQSHVPGCCQGLPNLPSEMDRSTWEEGIFRGTRILANS